MGSIFASTKGKSSRFSVPTVQGNRQPCLPSADWSEPSEGSIAFGGRAIDKLPAHAIVKLGIAQVPEGRRIFNTLTVQENLNLGAFVSKDSGW